MRADGELDIFIDLEIEKDSLVLSVVSDTEDNFETIARIPFAHVLRVFWELSETWDTVDQIAKILRDYAADLEYESNPFTGIKSRLPIEDDKNLPVIPAPK